MFKVASLKVDQGDDDCKTAYWLEKFDKMEDDAKRSPRHSRVTRLRCKSTRLRCPPTTLT